ncbi:hypothetical protein [Diaminobutyricibacter sp. McL0608]|uniref:hypothetical protein n=1 Tax=Leifsonia sp. McL0608 TaxID=3143537 RepID=UPI0031F306D8
MTDINQPTGFTEPGGFNQTTPMTTGTGTDTDTSEGIAGVAREQAAHVAEAAQESGQHVVDTAKDEAANVAREAKYQLTDLYEQAQDEVKDQAAVQQERVAARLRDVSDQFSQMARNSSTGGMATDLVHEAAARTGEIASWLDQRDPGALLDEVRSFARRRPGTFIAVAALAGVLAGRLTRSVASGASESSTETDRQDRKQTRPPIKRPPRAHIVPAMDEYPASGASESPRATGTSDIAGTEWP